MCNDNKNSTVVGFAIGAALGAGAGVLLSTKKGRKLMKQAWRQVEPYVDDATDRAKEGFEDVRSKTEDTISQVKDFADQKIPAGLKKSVKKTFFKGV